MNIFYTPPNRVYETHLELTGQEAKHATKVLRFREGDSIQVVNGMGSWFDCTIAQITGDTVKAEIQKSKKVPEPDPELVLAMGIIKKRDRLEFAVEKCVELGVSEIVLFRSRHTVKENVRMERLEMTALSAMKQSLRAYLPTIRIFDSLQDVLENHQSYQPLIAHEKEESKTGISADIKQQKRLLLLVGPEGGFSEKEITSAVNLGAEIVSLGHNRLRAETAAIVFLSQFI